MDEAPQTNAQSGPDEASRGTVFLFSKFLEEQIAAGQFNSDMLESIEVAKQCLEQAYDVTVTDPILDSNFGDLNLKDYVQKNKKQLEKEASDEEKKQAEEKKLAANELMKNSDFNGALKLYTEALTLNPCNAVYYCNRAAAYSKLNQHQPAIADCKNAIRHDPSYSKAFGRMGLAYSSLNQHADARECFEKAVSLDPNNESYKSALEEETKLMQEQAAQAGFGAGMSGMGMGPGGMPDLGSLLNNPNIMNMAAQMMQNPQMQGMMGQMMQAMGGGAAGGSDSASEGAPPPPNFEALMQMGQQFAQQMQEQNPELINQLRQGTGSNNGSNNAGSGGNNNDDDPPPRNDNMYS